MTVTAAWTWLRLSYRQQRWTVFLVVGASVAAAAGMLYIANQIVELRGLRDACLAQTPGSCDVIVARAYQPTQTAQLFLQVAELAPFAIGIILGAPLIAREIESRTAAQAWTLSRSRTRWLIGRAIFVVAVAVICLALLAWTSEVVAALLDPERNLARDFNFAESRGPILVARVLAVLGVSLFVGAVAGRVLPALLAAMLVVAAVFIGFGFADGAMLRAEARVVRVDPETGTGVRGDHWVTSGLQLADGTSLTWDEVAQRGIRADFAQDGGDGCRYATPADMTASDAVGCEVAWIVSGDRYPEITARRSAMLGGIGLVALVGAMAVVERRRPE